LGKRGFGWFGWFGWLFYIFLKRKKDGEINNPKIFILFIFPLSEPDCIK
jgi:hypothetical protein